MSTYPETLNTQGEPLRKKESIISDLRLRIVGGELSPGVQLPTRHELERRYRVSRDTVQRALDRLHEEEFVFSNGRRGTYVSPHPPHLTRYALVFESHPDDEVSAWVYFERALTRQAESAPALPERRLAIYRGIGSAINGEDYLQLESEIQDQRIAGLIFAFDPLSLRNTPLMQEARLARVAIVPNPVSVPSITFSMSSFADRALDFLESRGRKRVAVISHKESQYRDNLYLKAGMEARRMVTRRYWMQTANVRTRASANECVHLLMHPEQDERPDALIIDNDNLVEHAVAGLVAAGVRVPEDVEVVAHANFPLRGNPLPVPVTWLGFDIRHLFSACFSLLEAQQKAGPVPASMPLGAIFEWEVNPDGPDHTPGRSRPKPARSHTLRHTPER